MDKKCLLSVLVALFVEYVIGQEVEGPSLLCANRETIRKVDLATKAYTEIVTKLNRSVAVDYHYEKGLLIWTDVVTEKIYSEPFGGGEGRKKVLVDVCVTPDGVAVDWIHDNLYWTDTGKNVIGVARLLDGSFHKTLFDKNLDEPRAIVLDPVGGWMFWTDWGYRPKIERAGMDGSQRSTIISTGIRWPNGLAIDLASERIYWIDGKTHVLASANYNGADERVLISSSTTLKHPFSLDILGDWLYWTEWAALRESLYKANKNTGSGTVTQILGGSNWSSVMGLKVYDRSKQPPGFNRCADNGMCTHLCLPSPVGVMTYACACPDGTLPTDNCSTIPLVETTSVPATTIVTTAQAPLLQHGEPLMNSTNERRNQEPVANSSIPSGAIIGITLGVLILALVIFYIRRKISTRIGQARMTSEGWTGIDNPVYCQTTEYRANFEKAAEHSQDIEIHRSEQLGG